MRQAGNYGRRRDLLSLNRPRLELKNYLTGAVPSHPSSQDYLKKLSNWQMLGNDQYGDCVSVTWANTRRLVTSYLSAENYPSLPEVITFYKTQNPGFPAEDNGMDIQTALSELVKKGGPDGTKALAFAAVDYTSPEEIKAAIALFGSVWIGINVLDTNETEFSRSQPWDYNPGGQNVGGHSIIVGGYGKSEGGALAGDEKFITWAEETSFTDAFWNNQVEEAWVVIWPEHLGTQEFQAGVDLSTLAADYKALTGRDFPVVTPPAPPVPVPPVPVNADQALAAVAKPWADQVRTRPDLVKLKAALEAWLSSKGF